VVLPVVVDESMLFGGLYSFFADLEGSESVFTGDDLRLILLYAFYEGLQLQFQGFTVLDEWLVDSPAVLYCEFLGNVLDVDEALGACDDEFTDLSWREPVGLHEGVSVAWVADHDVGIVLEGVLYAACVGEDEGGLIFEELVDDIYVMDSEILDDSYVSYSLGPIT